MIETREGSNGAQFVLVAQAISSQGQIYLVISTMSTGPYASQFQTSAQNESSNVPKAIIISGAGTEVANGVYKACEKMYCNANSYEHVERGAEFRITREPHQNPKTGQVKHGWLLGQNNVPLYGVRTESLIVPCSGWKQFGGEAPPPSVRTYLKVVEALFACADDFRREGDIATEEENLSSACECFAASIKVLKRCPADEWTSEALVSRAAMILSRRAGAHAKLGHQKAALRDAVAALDLTRTLTSAESIALECAQALGCERKAAEKLLEPLGCGHIVDPYLPIALDCVERWLGEAIVVLLSDREEAVLPVPTHHDADRYFDGLDETARREVLSRYLPDAVRPDGGAGVIHSAQECLLLMKKWEEVLSGDNFQQQREELWNRRGLSYPVRLRETKELIANALEEVLASFNFASGRPGLSRMVKQMQQYWSYDKACAQKALDLEDMADVSLADLE